MCFRDRLSAIYSLIMIMISKQILIRKIKLEKFHVFKNIVYKQQELTLISSEFNMLEDSIISKRTKLVIVLPKGK